MAQRYRIASCLLLCGALLPIAAGADSVYLKNGESFEGVEAVVSDDQVRIELAIGSLRLPMSKVERIEEGDSTLGEYRAREARLGRERADALGWLELAKWARAHDFQQGAAKAAFLAARLDPELPALDPVMAGLDFVYDEVAREWVHYDEAMRRQGLVEHQGDWITPEERRERARTDVLAEEPRSRTDDHLDKALDILAEAVAKPDAPPSNTTVIVQPSTVGFGPGFGFFPGFTPGAFLAPSVLHEPGIGSVLPFSLSGTFFTGDARVTRGTNWDHMTKRQPGSFIPASPRFFR